MLHTYRVTIQCDHGFRILRVTATDSDSAQLTALRRFNAAVV